MREEGCASWDRRHNTWGGRGEGLGTVLVWWGCTGMDGEEGRFWTGKEVRSTVWFVIGFRFCHFGPSGLGELSI
nr:hypothetical protein [Tanacetum cinerariifolium]